MVADMASHSFALFSFCVPDCSNPLSSETGFYTPPPLERIIAMGGGFLYTTGAEAENSAVTFSGGSVPPLYKNRSSI